MNRYDNWDYDDPYENAVDGDFLSVENLREIREFISNQSDLMAIDKDDYKFFARMMFTLDDTIAFLQREEFQWIQIEGK